MKKYFLLFAFLCALNFQNATAQTNACHVKISILTCSSGEESYATFGHTAIRIVDSTNHTDFVYGYGTFDFDDPNFLIKFIRGKLDYFLSVDVFENFMLEYEYEKRSVYEQELQLNCEQKQNIIKALQHNLQGNNRYYKYNFLFDNCTTRIRNLIFNSIAAYTPNPIVASHTTYRKLLHSYLDRDGKPWTKLGIDILLGSKTDKVVNVEQSMFLPDYLLKGLDSSKLKSTAALVLNENFLLKETVLDTGINNNIPLIVTIIVAVFVIIFSFVKARWARVSIKIFDFVFLFITGIIGILTAYLWVDSDHTVMQNNFNLLWALPTNFFALFFVWKKIKLAKQYFLFATVITILLLITWFIIPQQLNIALFPLTLAGLFRYIQLYRR